MGGTTQPTVDLGPQTVIVTRLAEGVNDAQMNRPTPCPEYAVRNLLGHLVDLSRAFRDAGRKDLGPSTNTDPGSSMPDVTPDWRTELPGLLAELAEAWRDPNAWAGETRAGGVDLPGAIAGLVAADELVIHGWDLARATFQPYAPDGEALRAAHDMLAPAADDPDTSGLFGPAVPVPANAPLLDRVIGLSGRDPSWSGSHE